MSFVVKYRGLDVTVDSIEQLDQLADRISPNGSAAHTPLLQIRPLTHSEHVQEQATVRTMVTGLVGNQKKFLSLLAVNGKLTDRELREKLSLDSNKALAGVMAGVSKAGKRNRLGVRIVDKTSFRSSGGDREYTYSLNPAVREEVKEAVESKGRV